MQRITPLATDHQWILQSLEVLRLMSDRLDADECVDAEDIKMVLGFLLDVGCECLDHTEQLLLRPALLRAQQRQHIQALKSAVARHKTIRPLFEDALAEVTSRKRFVLHASLLSKLLEDIIFEEDHSLLPTVMDLLNDPDGQISIQKFREKERGVSAVAAERSPVLRRLETKYAYPQCI